MSGGLAESDPRIAAGRRAATGLRPAGRARPARPRPRAGRLGRRSTPTRPVPRRHPAEPARAPSCSPSRRSGPRLQQPRAGWRRRRSPRRAARSPSSATAPIDTFLDRRRPRARRSCSPPSRRPAATRAALAVAAARDIAALERGVKMRTLYQHSARRSAVTRKYVAAVTARGAEVRTLDEFFNRMIVVDRRVAIIPGSGRPRRRDGDPRAGPRRLPRRRLRAVLGAGAAVHQHASAR